MKLYINKGNYGWYTTARNHKDKEDKAYVNLFFPKDTEPSQDTNCIDPLEWSLSCYKGKVGLTIFKYKLIEESKKDVQIEPDALPFY